MKILRIHINEPYKFAEKRKGKKENSDIGTIIGRFQ